MSCTVSATLNPKNLCGIGIGQIVENGMYSIGSISNNSLPAWQIYAGH